jgi:thiosulfate dehydrogenase [quinone] large subunit
MELIKDKVDQEPEVRRLEDPPAAKATRHLLFGDVRWAWLWFIIRIYVGWQWLQEGWIKLNDPTWTGNQAGAAITEFANGALAKTGGEHPDVQGWYAWFLQNAVLPNSVFWSYLVSWGETLVGIALILGVLTGIAAFFGTFMNINYLLAGSVSTNPILFTLATWLILAWKIAGWWGLDRWVLPALSRPLSPRPIYEKSQERNPSLRPLSGRRTS